MKNVLNRTQNIYPTIQFLLLNNKKEEETKTTSAHDHTYAA